MDTSGYLDISNYTPTETAGDDGRTSTRLWTEISEILFRSNEGEGKRTLTENEYRAVFDKMMVLRSRLDELEREQSGNRLCLIEEPHASVPSSYAASGWMPPN